jgi:alcohol dehydrogenase class IV
MTATPARSLVFPARVVVGAGAADSLGTLLLEEADPGPLLVVCDAVLAERGSLARPFASLHEAGFDVSVFDDVRGEPTVELAERVRSLAAGRGFVHVVGIGGGSAMDLAKVAAALAADPSLHLAGLALGDRLPACARLALVPTTAGTGAEATVVAMLTGPDGKMILRSPSFVPSLAVLDATLTTSLPPGPTAATGLDALAHALEAYTSLNATPLSDAAAIHAARLVAGSLERACTDGGDVATREQTLIAAHLAGQALNAGVVVGHSMAYVLAEQAHLPHGVSTAMALPYSLLYNVAETRERLDAIAPALTGDPGAGARELILWTGDLATRLGIPASSTAAGIAPGRAAEHAAKVIRSYPRPTNPRPIEQASLTRLFELMEPGDLAAAVEGWDGG